MKTFRAVRTQPCRKVQAAREVGQFPAYTQRGTVQRIIIKNVAIDHAVAGTILPTLIDMDVRRQMGVKSNNIRHAQSKALEAGLRTTRWNGKKCRWKGVQNCRRND